MNIMSDPQLFSVITFSKSFGDNEDAVLLLLLLLIVVLGVVVVVVDWIK